MVRQLSRAVAASGRRRKGGVHVFSYALVDAINALALYALLPYWVFSVLVRGKYREGILQRLGWLPPGPVRRGCIWVHGVSVGEILAARHLIARLGEEFPDRQVVLSTTTNTGQEVARREYPGHYVFYYPFDVTHVLGRVLSRLRPSMLVLLELEVWPNMLRLAEARGLPVVVVNGRLSARSYSFYTRFGRFRLGFFNRVSRYGVQVEEYAMRMRRLGIEPQRVTVTGSLKYDTVPSPEVATPQQLEQVRARLGIQMRRQVLVLGSTHPSEAPLLAGVVSRLRSRYPELAVVWVPRHPGRVGVVLDALAAHSIDAVRLTQLDAGIATHSGAAVVIGDTVGDLASFYPLATIVFVGKSLGVEKGGQNMLEPAALGRPVAVGRYTRNFRMEVEYLFSRGGLVVVEDADELASTFELWLADRAQREAVGAAARIAVSGLAGGTERSLDLIRQVAPWTKARDDQETRASASRAP